MPDAGEEGEGRGEEDRASTAEPSVQLEGSERWLLDGCSVDVVDVPDLLANNQGRHIQAADGGEYGVDEAKRGEKRTYGAEFTRPTSHCSLLAPALGGGWMPNCPGKNRLAPLITDSSIYDHASP